MYCLMSKIKVNWVNVIREHLFKVGKKLEYRIPYVILLSNFIDYFEIDVEGEVVEKVKALNQISAANLTKIGLKKMKNKKWICKADEESAAQDDVEEEESVMMMMMILKMLFDAFAISVSCCCCYYSNALSVGISSSC